MLAFIGERRICCLGKHGPYLGRGGTKHRLNVSSLHRCLDLSARKLHDILYGFRGSLPFSYYIQFKTMSDPPFAMPIRDRPKINPKRFFRFGSSHLSVLASDGNCAGDSQQNSAETPGRSSAARLAIRSRLSYCRRVSSTILSYHAAATVPREGGKRGGGHVFGRGPGRGYRASAETWASRSPPSMVRG
jgi:hypothetical protein